MTNSKLSYILHHSHHAKIHGHLLDNYKTVSSCNLVYVLKETHPEKDPLMRLRVMTSRRIYHCNVIAPIGFHNL